MTYKSNRTLLNTNAYKPILSYFYCNTHIDYSDNADGFLSHLHLVREPTVPILSITMVRDHYLQSYHYLTFHRQTGVAKICKIYTVHVVFL